MMIQDANKMIAANPELASQFQADPTSTLRTLAAMPLQTDVWIYRAAVIALGLVSFVAVTGTLVLAFWEKAAPDGVLVMAGAGFGALAALLKPPSAS